MTAPPLRVLVVLHSLTARTGGQLHVRDYSVELARRGHDVTVFSATEGGVGDELLAQGITMVSTFDGFAGAPDVIYGHSAAETIAAALHFGGTPTVFYCHGVDDWTTAPPRLSAVVRYLCTGAFTRSELVDRYGVDAELVHVLPNAVDLAVWTPRAALPASPRTAAVFSSTATIGDIAGILAACHEASIDCVVVGAGLGREASRPWDALEHVDLVFASGRCALEAIAMGCATVVWHPTGMAGLVTAGNVEELSEVNFGVATFTTPATGDALSAAIAAYSPTEAAAASDHVRRRHDLATLGHDLEAHLAAAASTRVAPATQAEQRWLAAWIQGVSLSYLREIWDRDARLLEVGPERPDYQPLDGPVPRARYVELREPALRVGSRPVTPPLRPAQTLGARELLEHATGRWEVIGLGRGLEGVVSDGAEGAALELVTEATDVRVWFWTHDWSGEVSIAVGDEAQRLDLYDRAGGFLEARIVHRDPRQRRLRIVPLGSASPSSHAAQVIVHRITLVTHAE